MPTTCASLVWCTASNRSPEEQGSTPVPHHAAGGRLSPDGPPPGEQGSIPKQRTGSGMDPPVFWAGNTGKSQTTHSVSPSLTAWGKGKSRTIGPSGAKCLLWSRTIRMAVPVPVPATSSIQSLGQRFRAWDWDTWAKRTSASVVRGSPAAGQGNFTRSWQQFPRGRSGEKRLDPRGAGPGEQGSRPRVSMAAETLEKPDNAFSIRPRHEPAQGFPGPPGHIVCKRLAGIRLESQKNQAGIPHVPAAAPKALLAPAPGATFSPQPPTGAPSAATGQRHTAHQHSLPPAATASAGQPACMVVPTFIAVADSPDHRTGPGLSAVDNRRRRTWTTTGSSPAFSPPPSRLQASVTPPAKLSPRSTLTQCAHGLPSRPARTGSPSSSQLPLSAPRPTPCPPGPPVANGTPDARPQHPRSRRHTLHPEPAGTDDDLPGPRPVRRPPPHPQGCKMHFSARAIAPAAPTRTARAMHLSNRGDASGHRNRHWNPGVRKTPAEMGDCPPFQLRIPCRSPMQSKSQFLYTSPASQRSGKIPCLERGGAQDPPQASYLRGYRPRPAARGMGYTPTLPRPPPDTGAVRFPNTEHHAQGSRPRHPSLTPSKHQTAIQFLPRIDTEPGKNTSA